MMKHLRALTLLPLFFVSIVHAQVATELQSVSVLTYDGPSYTAMGDILSYDFVNHMGRLSSDGTFTEDNSLPQRFLTSAVNQAILDGASLCNRYLHPVSVWDITEQTIPGHYSTHFERSDHSYSFRGTQYYIVSTKGDGVVLEPGDPYIVIGDDEHDPQYPEPGEVITFEFLYYLNFPHVYDFDREDWFYFSPTINWVFSYNKKEWYPLHIAE